MTTLNIGDKVRINSTGQFGRVIDANDSMARVRHDSSTGYFDGWFNRHDDNRLTLMEES